MVRPFLVVMLACGCQVPTVPDFEFTLGDDAGLRGDASVPEVPDAGARVLCPADGGWLRLAPLPGERAEVGVAALGDEVYVAGGYNLADFVVSTVEAYAWRTNSWRTVAALPRVLNHVNLVSYGGKLWALGALDASFRAVGSAWVYDPAANTWTPVASMPAGTERGAAAIAVVGDKLVVAGGYRMGSVADVSMYDPATDTWTALPALPTARDHGVGAAFGDTFFSIGGRRNYVINGRVDALSLDAGTWVSKAPMLTPRGGTAAATVGGKVVVAGGEANRARADGVFPQVEVYDIATDAWQAIEELPTPRHGTGGAGIDGVAFFPGGAIQEGTGASAANEAWCPPQ